MSDFGYNDKILIASLPVKRINTLYSRVGNIIAYIAISALLFSLFMTGRNYLRAKNHAIGILSGRTMYPRWFLIVSPFGVLTITMVFGAFLPAPFAGFLLALFGTWFMLVPNIASTIWLWKNYNYKQSDISFKENSMPRT